MSGFNSWEDDPAAQDENQDGNQDENQDENLAQRTQQNLNIDQRNGPGRFNANANTFQPGANSFQPGQPYQQYGAQQYGAQQYGAQQYGAQQYRGNNQFSQYQQHQYGGAYLQNGQQTSPQFAQAYNQQPPNYNQGYTPPIQQASARAVQIAKRPSPADPSSAAHPQPASQPASAAAQPKPKDSTGPPTLSIGGDTPGATAPKSKVFSIEVPQTTSSTAKEAPADSGSKAAAHKAIEKTGESVATTNGPAQSVSGRSSPSAAEVREAKREVDAVIKEQAAQVDEEVLEEVYGKEHVNIIFIGHVDAGKSTLGGSLLYATGMVDERTMDKLKREAKEAGTESWYLSWALDLTKEERSQGKTVEVGRAFFETEKRRYTVLDAPGHKTFVPSMLSGASQADVGILVISARKGEYETGFEKGGQTREHAILAKTQGVNQLLVAVNKMDDVTVGWNQARYKECTEKLSAFLTRQVGYSKKDITFMPISAQTSIGIKDRPKEKAPWYDGPSFLEYLDNLKSLERKVQAPFMMPINGKYKDMGTVVEGKIEAGQCKKGSVLKMMPNGEEVTIGSLYGETEEEVPGATCGDQVRMRIRGAEEEDILPGYVLCSPKRPVHCVKAFEAQIKLLELKSILSAGFGCVLHIHSAIEEVNFAALLHKLEKGTGRKSKKPPAFAKQGQSIIARLELSSDGRKVCVERYDEYNQMGRFTLRDQGQTIAIGKITRLITDA